MWDVIIHARPISSKDSFTRMQLLIHALVLAWFTWSVRKKNLITLYQEIVAWKKYRHFANEIFYLKDIFAHLLRFHRKWFLRIQLERNRNGLAANRRQTITQTNEYPVYWRIYASPAWWRHQMETFTALLASVRGIHRSPVNSPHKGQWRGALTCSLICAWTNGRVNNRDAAICNCWGFGV